MHNVVERTADGLVVLFPGALGDFICFFPTLLALRHRHQGRLLLVAHVALLDLFRIPDLAVAAMHRREIADLFATGPTLLVETMELFGGFAQAYSWTGFDSASFAGRLSQATGAQTHVYPFRAIQAGEHAVDYYARCVGEPAPVVPETAVVLDDAWLTTFLMQHRLERCGFVVMHPGSGTARKNWRGFAALADAWRGWRKEPIVVLNGPAEVEHGGESITAGIQVGGLTLPQLAALLHNSALYVGNDSGVSHLAGLVGARGLVLFASSDPVTWAPRAASLRVVHAPSPCPSCGDDQFCLHRLPVDAVFNTLRSLV